MNVLEMIEFLRKDYKMHVVVHHADGKCMVREFYVQVGWNGEIEFMDKKTYKLWDSQYAYVGVAFFDASWEIYKYPEKMLK